MRRYPDALYPPHDEVSGYFRLVLPDVGLAEEKLPVEIRDIDGVWQLLLDPTLLEWALRGARELRDSGYQRTHIDNMYVLELRQGEVLQDLTSQSASATVPVVSIGC